ncbi:MAG: hypothetical protein RSF82_11115 [Angelakisella sp.]
MTIEGIKKLLDTTGYPVAYNHFKRSKSNTPPNPPFITYLLPSSKNFAADNTVYAKINSLQIELYTDKKDPTAEATLESALDGATIFYDKSETYIDSEQLYQIIYECEVM